MLQTPPATTNNRRMSAVDRARRLPMLRFLVVSTISTIIDYLVLFALVALLPDSTAMTAVAIAVGYLVGTVINFVLARAWVFTPTRMPVSLEFILVAIIGAIGLGLTELVTLWIDTHLGWHLLLAKTAAVVLVFCWNYLARRYLIYRKTRQPDPS
ncbi:MAG: GtrA family protein [Armatimonadota bacterium]